MTEYLFKTTPYEHQTEALRRAHGKTSFAWLMEMGTGKSKVAIDEISDLWESGNIDAAVIFAPKGVYMNWVNSEIPTHMPNRVYDLTSIVHWRAGGGSKDHQARLRGLLRYEQGLPILVMNIEALSSGTRGYLYLTQFLNSYKKIAGYVDESTTIRTPDATRTKRMMEVAKKLVYRRIMTGYVTPRSPLDIYCQFAFLGTGLLGFSSYYSFRARYAVMTQQIFGGRKVSVVVGYRDVEDLGRRMMPHSYRVKKEDCLDLPDKVYLIREVEMTEEQVRIYREIRDQATSALEKPGQCKKCEGRGFRRLVDNGEVIDSTCFACGGIGEVVGASVTATEVIVQILRLHQVLCGHVNDETGKSHDVPSNRIKELISVLLETDSKTIVWARYRRDIELIVEAIEKEFGAGSAVEYHGGVGEEKRKEALYRFQGRRHDSEKGWVDCPEKDQARFFVGNAQTGGFGLTLTIAKTVVYYSNDYDLEKRIQSEDRAHRSGQTKSVTYVDLVVPGTVDEKILKALRAKINISAKIMGDGYREWII